MRLLRLVGGLPAVYASMVWIAPTYADSIADANLRTDFSFLAPGSLFPRESGSGVQSRTILADITFPVEFDPRTERSVPMSMVYSYGGQHGPPGSQFHERNTLFPARDNFCEQRSHGTPFCPTGRGHQGCDIRAKPEAWVLAVADGELAPDPQPWTINLVSSSGEITYVYRHLTLASVKEALAGDRNVTRGQRIARVGNVQGIKGNKIQATHYHLHLEMRATTSIAGKRFEDTPLPCAATLFHALAKKHDISLSLDNSTLLQGTKFEITYNNLISPSEASAAPSKLDRSPTNASRSRWLVSGSQILSGVEVGLEAGGGGARALRVLRVPPGFPNPKAVGQILFTGRFAAGKYVGSLAPLWSPCGGSVVAVEGPVLGLRIALKGNNIDQEASCVSSAPTEISIVLSHLGSDGGNITDVNGLNIRDTLSEKSRNFLALTIYRVKDEPFHVLEYIKNFPGYVPSGGVIDSNDGLLPEFSSDEAGIAISWYWIHKRAVYSDPKLSPTPRQLAFSMAGVPPANCDVDYAATAAGIASERGNVHEARKRCQAVRAYIRGYVGLDGLNGHATRYFGKSLGQDETINLNDPEIRWKWMRTMYHHESGQPAVFDRDVFERGIIFAEDYMSDATGANKFRGIAFYSDPCNFAQSSCSSTSSVRGAESAMRSAESALDKTLSNEAASLEVDVSELEKKIEKLRSQNAILEAVKVELEKRKRLRAEIEELGK
ncbi:peptidoglycan DD-metalloendopeptidase family protein [Sinorhizobium medicae]|nr:peptidoglycan DD-metalloendopeptidase family protein [Sinorhizobium medicae]